MERKSAFRKAGKILLGILLSFVGLIAIFVIATQIVLSEKFLTKTVNTVAERYIDGDLKFGRVRASLFSRFPKVSVILDSVSLTYPADRFAEYEVVSRENRLMRMGRGEAVDTLASFDRFSAAINVLSLMQGKLRIPYLELSKPRIYAKSYKEAGANWNMISSILASLGKDDEEEVREETEESGSFDLSELNLGKLRFENDPLIVYCSPLDSLFAMLRLNDLSIDRHTHHYDINLSARTGVTMPGIGRVNIPIEINSEVAFPKDSAFAVSVGDLNAKLAGIPLKGDISARVFSDSLWINADASIDDCNMSDIIKRYGRTVWKEARNLDTDAILSLRIKADGWYNFDGSRLPAFDLALNIPDSKLVHSNIGIKSRIGADIKAAGGDGNAINVDVNDFYFHGNAIRVALKGFANDLLGQDPLFNVDSSLEVSLDTIGMFLDPKKGYKASGLVEADLKGTINMSQINLYRFPDADFVGCIRSDNLHLNSASDSLDVHIDSLDIDIKTVNHGDEKSGIMRVLSIKARLDSADVNYRNALAVSTGDVFLNAQSDAEVFKDTDTTAFHRLGGKLTIGRLHLTDSDSSRVSLTNSENSFIIFPSNEDKKIPVVSLTSKNGSIRVSDSENRAFVRDLLMRIYATRDGGQKSIIHARNYQAALEKKFPDMPKDTILERMNRFRESGELPDWLSEEDFKKKDFSFKLADGLMQYYNDWTFRGTVTVGRGGLMTPYFPLRTSINNFNGYVTNDEITLRSLTVKSGVSDMSANGKISGLRQALTENGAVRFTLDLSSNKLNVNELLGAYTVGSQHISSSTAHGNNDMMDDEAYQKAIVSDTLANVAIENPLLVVPANIFADLTLNAKDITYSKLQLDTVRAEISMRERCIQIRNTAADSNVGKLTFDGFYATRTKKDLTTGFDLTLSDVTAEKVIDMVPAVDSLLPMLKSFRGLLNCELAVTAKLDTTMNIMLPSMKGIARITGKNLALVESEDLFKILKILKFKDIHNINIEDMSVEAVVYNNKAEIFPFVLAADRYALALSGVQNLDQSFSYHISVLKSPLLVKFGVNLFGNFGNFKFKIGKAKYKDKRVPVFSFVINTARNSLRSSIMDIFSKGVDQVLKETAQLAMLGYESAALPEMDELSDEEMKQLDEEAVE